VDARSLRLPRDAGRSWLLVQFGGNLRTMQDGAFLALELCTNPLQVTLTPLQNRVQLLYRGQLLYRRQKSKWPRHARTGTSGNCRHRLPSGGNRASASRSGHGGSPCWTPWWCIVKWRQWWVAAGRVDHSSSSTQNFGKVSRDLLSKRLAVNAIECIG